MRVVAAAVFAVAVAVAVAAVGACRSTDARLWPDDDGAPALLFDGVRVFDGERAFGPVDVLVRGERIEAIGPALEVGGARGAVVVAGAGAGRTLLPGLIDAHVHVRDAEHLAIAAALGVTTVLDMYSDPALIARLKREAHHRPERASLLSAGIMATVPHGHGDQYGGIPTLRTPPEAQAFLDARIADGADYLKIVHDDGAAFGVSLPTLTEATMAALVDAAHARRRLAVVHVGSLEGAKRALAAGADGLTHVFADAAVDGELIELARARGAFVVPTLSVLTRNGTPGALVDDVRIARYLPGPARAALKRRLPARPGARNVDDNAFRATRALHAAGIAILAGSDASNPGVAPGATLHEELAHLVVDAGLTPLAALHAATAAPADAFHLDDRGRIAPGKRADLVLVDGDPTQAIEATRAIVDVWHRGVRVEREALAAQVQSARVAPGVVADFERGARTKIGAGVEVSTDALIGKSSTAAMRVESADVNGGDTSGNHALTVSGQLVAGDDAWSGVIFWTGARRLAAGDLSSTSTFRFRARGDGREYTAMIFTKSGGDDAVGTVRFRAPRDAWHEVVVPLGPYTSGDDVVGVWLGASERPGGAFQFAVDDVELR